jgi:SAM-dependent methyltransferase
MQFGNDIFEEMRRRLLDAASGDLIEFMYRKQGGEDTRHLPNETTVIAKNLGWIESRSEQFTELGRCAADSCREYTFWLQRRKALPFEGKADHLSASYFVRKSVVEIGCGMGANLMSISGIANNLLGVEPIKAYAQVGSIFREREKMPPLDVHIGSAESLPFEDGQIDLIFCVAAHHYFDIRLAFREFARVLKPGGEVLIIGDTWDTEAWLVLSDSLRKPVRVKRLLVDAINTMSYTALRRRIIPARGNSTTSRPIFPSRRSMNRWLHEAGLIANRPMIRSGPDTCYSTQKLS